MLVRAEFEGEAPGILYVADCYDAYDAHLPPGAEVQRVVSQNGSECVGWYSDHRRSDIPSIRLISAPHWLKNALRSFPEILGIMLQTHRVARAESESVLANILFCIEKYRRVPAFVFESHHRPLNDFRPRVTWRFSRFIRPFEVLGLLDRPFALGMSEEWVEHLSETMRLSPLQLEAVNEVSKVFENYAGGLMKLGHFPRTPYVHGEFCEELELQWSSLPGTQCPRHEILFL